MGVNNIYSKNGYFAVAQTGNTLGMAGTTAQAIYFVNAWVTLDPTQNNGVGVPSNTGTFTFGGTSNSYLSNGSFAYLNPPTTVVPSGSTVDYAVVTWAGTIDFPSSLALFNVATIPFTDPTGAVNILTPNLALNNEPAGAANIISRSADVTTIVSNAGYGRYTIERVPGATLASGQERVAGAGWTLVVVYKNSNLPYRNVSINVGTLATNAIQTISGFYTPSSGPTVARVFGSWTQGNSDYANEAFKFNGTDLSGPNNPVNNFFCSQINDDLGFAQNTFGSFADQSSTPGQRPVGQRTCYDITNVSANGVLTNSQRSTTVQVFAPGGLEVANTHVVGVQIDNNAPSITAIKSVDLTDAKKGNTLNYTITFRNTSSETASNVVFLDTIPTNTTFNDPSLFINGAPSPLNPQNGVALPSLGLNSVVTVQFSVNVSSSLTQGVSIPNIAQLSYNFIGDPSLPTVSATITSNTVTTNINIVNLNLTKSRDKAFAAIGETILYTLVVENSSINNMTSLTFVDTIPNGTTFVPNSLTIDGTTDSGNPNPPGVSLGALPSNTVRTVTFRVLVSTIPTVNPIANIGTVGNNFGEVANSQSVFTTINSAVLAANKIVNKNYGNIGDILTYTIPISNIGNVTANSILFLDTIPNGTALVLGSFRQDGIVVSGSPDAPGVTLPNSLIVGGVTTVTFQVTVITIPVPNPIQNSAVATSIFTVDPTTTPNRTGTLSTNTNIVNTLISFASLSGITKFVDKSFATCGDIVTYQIVAPNSGNTTAFNVIFKDTIPNGTSLVSNSVTVNGVTQSGANLATGVTVPNIAPGGVATLTFSVVITCL